MQPSDPLSSPSTPAFNLSKHQVFSNKSVFTSGGHSIGVSASASVLPMNIQDRFPDFPRMDWLGLFAVQGTLKSLLQHHNSKALILWRLAYLKFNSHMHT